MTSTRSLLFTESAPLHEGMIFDFDGTIANSMDVWYWVDQEFLRRRNLIAPPDYGKMLSTRGFVSAADYVIQHFELDENPLDIMDEWNALALERYATDVFLKPHARTYLEQVRSLGITTSIATTLSPVLLNAALENNQVADLFDTIATGYEVDHDKNEPDIYLLAAERMKIKPAACVVYEDILPGILSAKRVGMCTIAVRDNSGHQEVEALYEAADGFIDSFEELLL